MRRPPTAPLPRLVRRVACFFELVWRPCTGPNRDEPPMNGLQIWWHYGISVRTAWSTACIIED